MNKNTIIKSIGILVTILLTSCLQKKSRDNAGVHQYNDFYTQKYLDRIAFPIGGIGAGMFCLEGTGAISHMSVRNRPEVFNEPCMFAAISVKGIENGVKIIEGQVPGWKHFGQPNSGNGSSGSTYGLPRFKNSRFLARYPFAFIDLNDDDLPLTVQIKGWSPFIPTDADNSSLPVGALEYSFKNITNSKVEALFSYNSRNFMRQSGGKSTVKGIIGGFVLSEEGTKENPENQGEFAIFTCESEAIVDHSWFRGGWWDPLTMTWNAILKGEVRNTPPSETDSPGASVYIPFTLNPGDSKVIRLLMAWYVPNTTIKFGQDSQEPDTEKCADLACCCHDPFYKPWYAGKFADINEVVAFWKTNYNDLISKSELFSNAFYDTTLPPEVTESIAANLTILKSPTVLRQTDGKLWSYEGCNDNSGCCTGSCTHVWNYAQAVPHLFPKLERTLRETEFFPSQDMQGHQTFRSALPIRPVASTFYAAADGQLGGIMKMYRDWRISGDTEWLKKMYPKVVESMNYSIKTWDPHLTGTLEEPHHNTYDIEFWGPDGMCTSFYLGALKAIIDMGKFLEEDISKYEVLLIKSKNAVENELFNGEYFIQKIKWEGLNAPDPVKASASGYNTTYSDEALNLLRKEGPKYQYGTGCLSDGILGDWLGEVCGMKNIVDSVKILSHLNSVYRYNFMKDLTDHSNPQRPSYALGNEGGLLICTWPKGGKLSLPFVYSDEVWTGIEYQVASHLMMMGEVDKGLEIVRTCCNRYDGSVRNPFDEYECGHWYARAMSSYAMLQALTGVRYDAIDQVMYIDSKIGNFISFISTATGFGTISLKNGEPSLDVVFGEIIVKRFIVK